MEFITAEVEVQGNPAVKPGAMVNIKKVGAYSGHYLVTEANHFYDAGGYHCIFYVARDKWGNSSAQQATAAAARAAGAASSVNDAVVDVTLVDENGSPVPGAPYRVIMPDGRFLDGCLDDKGRVRIEGLPRGNYKVTFPGRAADSWDPA
jgi:hypothetical protein